MCSQVSGCESLKESLTSLIYSLGEQEKLHGIQAGPRFWLVQSIPRGGGADMVVCSQACPS